MVTIKKENKPKNNNKKAIEVTKVKRPNNNKPVPVVVTNQKQKKKLKKKKSSKILNIILSLFMVLGILIMCAIMAFCGYIVLTAPSFEADKLYSKEATIIYDRNGNEYARLGSEQRELKTYEELPEVLIDAIVATEDGRFFQHNGFDVVRFVKASFGQFSGQDGAGGASTLTMQVAKNTFSKKDGKVAAGLNSAGITRKFHDIYMSIFLIEKNYTKEEIMEFYVNSAFLGQWSYGVEQASQTYFGKSVSDLSLAEAVIIAGAFNAPTMYNPFNSIELTEQRRDTVLNLMVKHEYITEEQAQEVKDIPIESLIVEPKSITTNKYQQFIDTVCNEVENYFKELYNDPEGNYNPYVVPMEIYSTMDPEIQDTMVKLNNGELGYKWTIPKYMKNNEDKLNVSATVTDVRDGSVLAVNNGRNQNGERQLIRSLSHYQPGSTIKPIMDYGPFIEYNNGNPGTLFIDQKMTYSTGQVISNSDGVYKGVMTMRQALAQSRNIPAVQAFMAVDRTKIGKFANALGIDYYKYDSYGNVIDTTLYESYAVGGGLEVSTQQMAGAYGAFARGGYYIEPYTFTKVILRETDEVFEKKYEKIQAMSPETAYMITDMLMTATSQGVGGTIRVSGTQVASKSGTSTYDSASLKANGAPITTSADNWGILYSPDYVISVRYGVDQLEPNVYTTTLEGAAERRKITGTLANNIFKPNSKFTKPDGVISASYELETNPAELPSAYTPTNLISTELFKKGTEPSEISKRFSALDNPTNGSYEVSNGQINLSWNEISTPDAINDSYLENYFNRIYGDASNTFLEQRRQYNSSNIGLVGYQIYLNTDNGLQPLDYTTNSYYVYNAPYNGTYTFTIKSAYSIFKANMSSGIQIKVKVTDSGNEPPIVETPDDEDDNELDNNP